MKNMTQKIELAFIGYNPDEFFPVFREGSLDNKGEFILYKTKKATLRIGKALDRAYFAAGGTQR